MRVLKVWFGIKNILIHSIINNAKNRELIERFRTLKVLYNLKKNMQRCFNAQKEENEKKKKKKQKTPMYKYSQLCIRKANKSYPN